MATAPSSSHEDMRKQETQILISDISDLIEYNSPNGETNFFPHTVDELNDRAVNLGYNSAMHFCVSFPEWFTVDETGLICLNCGPSNRPVEPPYNTTLQYQNSTARVASPQPKGFLKSILKKGSVNNGQPDIDPLTMELLAKYKPTPPSFQSGVIKGPSFQCSVVKGEMQSIEPTKKADCIHFKFAHEGKTRRFAFPRDDSDLVESVKQRIHKIIGATKTFLYWNDNESLVVLECDDDMSAAIDFAEKTKKPPCIAIEATVHEENQSEEKKDLKEQPQQIVTRDESSTSFNGFAFMCDSCDAYLSSSNGGRYKCTVCHNYDLCAACVAKGVHDNHALILLRNSQTVVPLSDSKGELSFTQLMETPRCTPTFVILKQTEKKAKRVSIDETIHRREELEEQKRRNWEKVMETMDRQRASYEKQRENREVQAMEPKEEDSDPVSDDPWMMKCKELLGDDCTPQKTEEQKRREQNLQNAIKNPFEKMAEEDREVWRILNAEKELQENTMMNSMLGRDEQIRKRRKIEDEDGDPMIVRLEGEQRANEKVLKKFREGLENGTIEERSITATRDEIALIEKDQMRIEKELLKKRMEKEKESREQFDYMLIRLEGTKVANEKAVKKLKEDLKNVPLGDKWRILAFKEEILSIEKDQMRIEKELLKLNMELEMENLDFQWVWPEVKKEEINEDGNSQQKELTTFSSGGSDLEVIDMKLESGTTQPFAGSAAPAASPIFIAADAAAVAPPEPSPDFDPSINNTIMSLARQELLAQLLATDIFDDYDRMVEVCQRAQTLDQAIEMMLDDSAPTLAHPTEYI